MSLVQRQPNRTAVYGALLGVQVLFGLNYAISKVVVQAFPPMVWASVRLWIATLVLGGYAWLSGLPFPKEKGEFLKWAAIFSIFGIVLNQSAFLVGLKYTTAVNSAILNTLTPILTLMIAIVQGTEKINARRAVGFASAFAGVLIVRRIETFSLSDQTLMGDLLMIFNCLSFSFYLVFSKSFWQRFGSVWATVALFFFGSIGVTLLSIPSWNGFVAPEMTQELWFCSAYAILGATLMTYVMNNFALAHAKSSHVALFINLQPVVASVLAVTWFGEAVTSRTVCSYLLIFCGMILVLRPSAKEDALKSIDKEAINEKI